MARNNINRKNDAFIREGAAQKTRLEWADEPANKLPRLIREWAEGEIGIRMSWAEARTYAENILSSHIEWGN